MRRNWRLSPGRIIVHPRLVLAIYSVAPILQILISFRGFDFRFRCPTKNDRKMKWSGVFGNGKKFPFLFIESMGEISPIDNSS